MPCPSILDLETMLEQPGQANMDLINFQVSTKPATNNLLGKICITTNTNTIIMSILLRSNCFGS